MQHGGDGDADIDALHDHSTGSSITGIVVSVSSSEIHAFSKSPCDRIRLVAGMGVFGDAHCGETVKHRSRVARDPTQPNLRQVHLIHEELFDELATIGHSVAATQLGENITTRGIALLGLPTGTRLRIGSSAVIQITGLRNPCVQIERFQQGLLAALVSRGKDGSVIRKAGVMAVVEAGGAVQAGDRISVDLPSGPHRRLEPV